MSKPTTSPTRMPREQRRAQLIEVALEVFAEHGYAQTTMDVVAQHASVSKPVLYQHFENKRDLFFTLIDLQFDALRDSITSRMQSVDPDAETVDEDVTYQAVRGVFEFIADPRGLHRLLQDTSMEHPEELESRKDQFINELVEFVSPYILDNSILEPASAKFITFGIASVVIYLANRWAAQHTEANGAADPIPLDQAVAYTCQFVAHGAIGFDLSNNPAA